MSLLSDVPFPSARCGGLLFAGVSHVARLSDVTVIRLALRGAVGRIVSESTNRSLVMLSGSSGRELLLLPLMGRVRGRCLLGW